MDVPLERSETVCFIISVWEGAELSDDILFESLLASMKMSSTAENPPKKPVKYVKKQNTQSGSYRQ